MSIFWYFLMALGFLIMVLLSVPSEGAVSTPGYLMSLESSLNSGVPA